MIKITIPMTVLDSEAEVQQLAISAVLKGAKPIYEGSDVIYPINSKYMPLDYAKLLVSKGATVDSYPLFIEINSKDDEVPVGLPNATVTDEEGVTTANTWTTWKASNHHFMERDERIFIGTNATGTGHIELSQLAPVFDKLLAIEDLPAPDVVEL